MILLFYLLFLVLLPLLFKNVLENMVIFKKGLLSIIFSLLIMLMIPFSVSANASLPAPFVGYNIYIYDSDTDRLITNYSVDLDASGFQMTCSNMQSSGGCMTYRQTSNEDTTGTITLSGSSNVINHQTIMIELILDDEYVGYVNLTHSGQAKNYYVNGNKLQIYTQYEGQTITVNSYQLNRVSSDNIMWMFPIESYSAQTFGLGNLEMDTLVNDSYWMYACFNLKTSDVAMRFYGNPTEKEWFIFWISTNIYSLDSLKSNFTLSQGEFETYQFINRAYFNGVLGYIIKAGIGNIQNYVSTTITYNGSNTKYIPIYINEQSRKYISTDFALNYGLSNSLLDNINIIAQGTTQSNQSTDNLGNSSDQMNNQMQNLIQTEDSYNEQFNNSLQNIDFTSPAGNQNLLSSANFVITVFNGLIQNNFLSILIIIICILIIGKKVIGK